LHRIGHVVFEIRCRATQVARAPGRPDWQFVCGWSERLLPHRFTAVVDRSLSTLVVVGSVSALIGLLAAMMLPFGSDRVDITAGVGLAGFVASFVPLARYARGAVRVRVEVTPEVTIVAWREARFAQTSAIRNVELCRGEEDSAWSASWGVRLAHGEQVLVVPVWTRSEREARMRAERLRDVISFFQSAEPASGSLVRGTSPQRAMEQS
jgi:hypothetical protein